MYCGQFSLKGRKSSHLGLLFSLGRSYTFCNFAKNCLGYILGDSQTHLVSLERHDVMKASFSLGTAQVAPNS
jgi:hypothetical protein